MATPKIDTFLEKYWASPEVRTRSSALSLSSISPAMGCSSPGADVEADLPLCPSAAAEPFKGARGCGTSAPSAGAPQSGQCHGAHPEWAAGLGWGKDSRGGQSCAEAGLGWEVPRRQNPCKLSCVTLEGQDTFQRVCGAVLAPWQGPQAGATLRKLVCGLGAMTSLRRRPRALTILQPLPSATFRSGHSPQFIGLFVLWFSPSSCRFQQCSGSISPALALSSPSPWQTPEQGTL